MCSVLQRIQLSDLQPIYSGNKSFVYLYKNFLPRAYFVNTVSKKPAIEMLNLVKNTQFDPRYIAFTDEEISGIEVPDSAAYVRIEKYDDEYVTLNVNASGNNFLFLGDTFMSGEADYKLFKIPTGWKAFIDGKETKIYRANHGFRGIVVPKGNHKIEFSYLPKSFEVSVWFAKLISWPLGLIVIGYSLWIIFVWLRNIFLNFRKNKNTAKSES